MSNPTTPFSWQMPTSTDLVTDLPADFEVFGQAVATSMADLLGGTTGQILSKTSNTDMDFTWIANDQGDITAVNVTSPITGGGSAGAVTVGIQDASTTQKGAVQLSDSTSTTSSVLASTPTAVKSSYDLAAAAIPKSTVTTNGDIIYGTGSGTVTRLGVGSTGQVLTVASGVPSWATTASANPYLAYVQVTAGNSTTSSSYVDVTSATITFTAPASGIVKLTIEAAMWATGGNQDMYVAFREGSTTILERTAGSITSASQYRRTISGVVTGVSAGSHTYKISIKSTNATYTTGIASISASPVFLTVETAG